MKFVVCENPGKFLIKEKSEPKRSAQQALVKIKFVGVCGTDIHAFAGDQPFFSYPRILGHELSGEILEVGENNRGLRPGDQVAIIPYIHCGECIACRRGKTNCCRTLQVLGVHIDGGMQERIALDSNLLIKANHLDEADIALIEPLSIGAHAVSRSDVGDNDTVLVIGCGPIGVGIIFFARQRGAKVIAMDFNADRLRRVEAFFGADQIVFAGAGASSQIEAITSGDYCTKVFDATGNKSALEKGPDYLAHSGSYTLVGLAKAHLSFYHPAIHAKEASILCSRNATMSDFETVMESLHSGTFPGDEYITRILPFEEGITNFTELTNQESGVNKLLFTFSS